jgi:hypothetical protein
MPLLREELQTFACIHNAHPIRAQRNRSQHVSGEPNELCRAGERHGFAANTHVLSALRSTLPDYRIVLTVKQLINELIKV